MLSKAERSEIRRDLAKPFGVTDVYLMQIVEDLLNDCDELEQQLADANEAVQVMALMRQHEKEATVVDQGYISQRGWNELKDENKRLKERLSKLEAGLEQIKTGGWTETGDRQGATYAEIRAMKMAQAALEK